MKTAGFEAFDKKLSGVIKRLPRSAASGVENAVDQTKDLAIRFAHGKVKGTIRAETIDKNGKTISGRVFNDTSPYFWSSFVEFGTGVMVDDQGNPDAIRLKRAKQIPWYIHVSMVPPEFAKYGHRIVVGRNGEQYYEVFGMQPSPYMHPAAFQSRDKNVQAIASEIDALFREVF